MINDLNLCIIISDLINEGFKKKSKGFSDIFEGRCVLIQRREYLIEHVLKNNKSITYVAKKLRIKYSIARMIINK